MDNKDISGDRPAHLTQGGGPTPITEDIKIYDSWITISLDFSEVLPGFILKPVESRLFIYGSKIVDILTITVKRDGEDLGDIAYDKSRYHLLDEYTGTELPGNGTPIELNLSADEIKIHFTVLVKDDKEVEYEWFDEPVSAELLIWLPYEFLADPVNGAEVSLPLFGESDLFGRGSGEDGNPLDNLVETLELAISFSDNPFLNRTLLVQSGSVEYENVINFPPQLLTGKTFGMILDENIMAEINNPAKFPFAPRFRIEYKPGEGLDILQNFKEIHSNEFLFKAKINYRMDL